jgi:signal transduction histidine kinase/ActR/RegA family two-component response regulator
MNGFVEIDKLRRQQTSLANFGSFALNESDLQNILTEAARVCAVGLGTRYSKICRYRPDENDLLIEAGYGWRIGLVGNVVSKADASSPQGRAFTTGDPAICEDVRLDQGFELPNFYPEHGIISTIDVLIRGSQKAYGVLEIDSDVAVSFDQQDIIFLTGFANVLAEALATAEQKARESEFARTEQELRARAVESKIAAETALQTAKARTALIATMSHELRTPLNAIVGFSRLLSKTQLDKEQRSYVAVLQDNASHLHSLVNNILDYARMEAGKVVLEKAPFAIREVVSGVAATTTALVANRPISIHWDVDPEVSSVFFGDATRIRQILLNIVGNATKFTKDGSIFIRVMEVSKSPENPTIRFEVQDTGIGIDPALHEKIFDFYERAGFQQLGTEESSGLGLAISRAIVRMMQGSIGVKSEIGKGSTFWFEIPLQIAQPISVSSSTDEPIEMQVRKNLKILIAEDTDASRLLLEIMLKKLGQTVISCKNGAEAVVAASRERFDLIILDLQMPVMGGVEATRRIRAMGEHVGSKVIVAITAYAFPEQHEAALDGGMDQIINKPFDELSLINLIESWPRSSEQFPARDKWTPPRL